VRFSKLYKRILIRLAQTIPLLFLVIAITFIILSYAPGDPAQLLLGSDATPENVVAMREEMGLNEPLLIQLWEFTKNMILHGDLGLSYQKRRPVTEEIVRTLPVTVKLSLIGITISTIVGIFVGVISAVKQYSFLDNLVRIVVLMGVSMPVFWLGLMLLFIFSASLKLLPSFGWGSWKQMILPSITLSAFSLAMITRMTRSSMLDVIRQDYITTARAKGLSNNKVIYHHALRNALIPVVTVIGLQFAVLLTGAVLAETVFALPGLGRLTVTAVYARDYPIIRGAVILAAISVSIINLIVDILYTILNPRIESF